MLEAEENDSPVPVKRVAELTSWETRKDSSSVEFFLMFISERERDKELPSKEGADRGREGESQAGSTLSVQSPMPGSNLRPVRT